MKFDEMGLSPEAMKSIAALGFETPTPIQEQAIPVLMEGKRDFVGLASTGTGKTAAFGLPLLERVNPSIMQPQGVILCPTRELCLQINEDLRKYTRHRSNLKTVAVYGGSSIVTQIRDLKHGAQIIVATPGRLLDLIARKAAKLDQVTAVVLDEADEMLNMGFKEELDSILGQMPAERVTWLFSATMAKGVERIAKNYQTDPVFVSVGGRNESAENIQHLCFMVHERDRYQALKRILDFLPNIYGLVFCRTRAETQQVAEKLMQDGYSAESLHGDLSQAQRDAVMRKFRQKTITILVATDVAARGLDVDDITHVIHYKLSDEISAYTHRSGRTARAGKSGVSIALINLHERRRIRELERRNNITIKMDQVPDGRAICQNRMISLLNRVIDTPVNEDEIREYLPIAYEALCHLDKKEIIKRFVAVEFNQFLEYYRHAGDINASSKGPDARPSAPRQQRPDNKKRRDKFEAYDTKVFSINMGKIHKINAGAIVRLLCESCGLQSNQIGEIDLGRDQSFFQVSKEVANVVREGMDDIRLDGRKVSIRAATSDRPGGAPHASGRRPSRSGGRR